MDDIRSLRGCSELTLFARFLIKFVMRTPRWQNRNTDQRLVRIGLHIQQTNHFLASITSKLGIVVLITPVSLRIVDLVCFSHPHEVCNRSSATERRSQSLFISVVTAIIQQSRLSILSLEKQTRVQDNVQKRLAAKNINWNRFMIPTVSPPGTPKVNYEIHSGK